MSGKAALPRPGASMFICVYWRSMEWQRSFVKEGAEGRGHTGKFAITATVHKGASMNQSFSTGYVSEFLKG